MPQMTRRTFLTTAGLATVAATCVNFGAPLRTLAATLAAGGKVDVGLPADFDKQGAVDTWAGQHRFFVIRQGDQLFALPSICTHEPKKLVAQNDKQRLYCAEHKSTFSLDGRVLRGKPKKSLARLGIELAANGHILIDPAKKFSEPDWDKPGSHLDPTKP